MPESAYHHGNLKQALVESALALLRERPADEIGLREVARRIGVSTAAPYRHFESRDSLLSALASHGFRELERRLRGVVEENGPGALAELGQAYVRFALENRNLFGLMLRGERGVPNEELRAAGQAAFNLLQAAVDDLAGTSSREGAAGAWALVHGLSILAIERQLAPDLLELGRFEVVVRDVTKMFETGLHGASRSPFRQRADET
jgi:AcrR family transcriptional regulator